MSARLDTFGRRREAVAEAFRRVADAVGGSYHDLAQWGRPTRPGRPAVQRERDGMRTTMEWATTDHGTYLQVVAPFRNPERFRFVVRSEGFFDDLLKKLGFLQDVEVGDAGFDARYVVKGFPVARVREVLSAPVPERIRALGATDLRVLGRRPAYPWPGYPEGVDELYFRQGGVVTDVDRLVGLFELFGLLVPRLDPAAVGYEDDPALLVRRLLAPGGTVHAPGTTFPLWDGDTPRRDAARRLGELGETDAVEALISVLDDEDEELVVAAADALGRLGDPVAVPRLVGVLGDRLRETADGTPAEAAGRALEALGAGEVARAFEAALDGEPEPLRRAAGPHRDRVVEALMTIVASENLHERPDAARALGVLGANEALPLLRDRSRAMGMQTRMTEAASAAIAEIEKRASLPRPAEGAPESPDTHPRPAEEPGPDTGTLPRSAEG